MNNKIKYTKQMALDAWKDLAPDQPMLRHFIPLHYKASGSRYGTCGIRIDGTPLFIDSVLSHLKELIGGENGNTRLVLSRSVVGEFGDHDFSNKEDNAEVCYIRLQERGDDAKFINALGEMIAEHRREIVVV